MTKAEGDAYEIIKLYPGHNQYQRLVIKNNVLVGYIMVGNTSKAGLLTTMLKEKIPLGKYKAEFLQGRFRQKILW